MFYDDAPRPFFVLAPMDDVTDSVFRQVVNALARPDYAMTEFVNVDGLQSEGRHKLLYKLQSTAGEQPLVAQIWGKTPENYEKTAAEAVGMGFAGIDINMGCPDKAVVKNGCCVALVNNRPLAAEIIAAVKRGAAGRVPVSVKTRLGFNAVDLSWHEFLLRQDVAALTVHLRTRSEMSKVPAHWGLAPEVVKLRDAVAPHTKIIGNGDVLTRTRGLELARQTGVDGVMIGRGVLQNPFAFAPDAEERWAALSQEQRRGLFRRHVELFARTWQPGQRNIRTLNKFAKLYIQGFDGAKDLRERLMTADSTGELVALLAGR